MKWNIDDLPVFVAVAEMRGVTGAAKLLNMPKSTVSRTLTRLEDDLKIRLFNRNTRDFNLTAEGVVLFHHAQVVLDHVKATDEAVAGLQHTPSGTLKVSLPMAFSREILGNHLLAFNNKYPQINLQIQVTPHNINLIREDLDLAFVVGLPDNSDIVAKKVLDSPLIWVASPDYAARAIKQDTLLDLQNHMVYCERRYQLANFEVRDHTGWHNLNKTHLMSINDPLTLRQLICNGGGIAVLPEIYCQKELEAGLLQRVYHNIICKETAQIYALMPSLRLQPQKARLFIEFVENIVKRTIGKN